MSTTGRRAHTTLAILLGAAAMLAVAVLVVAGVVLWSRSTVPFHRDAASVPSRRTPCIRPLRRASRGRAAVAAGVAAGNIPGSRWRSRWMARSSGRRVRGPTPTRRGRSRHAPAFASRPVQAVDGGGRGALQTRGASISTGRAALRPRYPPRRAITTRQLLGDVAGVHRIRGETTTPCPPRTATTSTTRWRAGRRAAAVRTGRQHRYSIWAGCSSAPRCRARRQPFERVMTARCSSRSA